MSVAGAIKERSTSAKQAPRKSLWRRTTDVVGTLFAVVAVMVAAVVMVVAVGTRLSAKEQYTAFGHPVLVVLSGSMSPVINTGDLIVDNGVSADSATKLHAGQIITFYDQPGSRLVFTHRIVRVVHQRGRVLYETKGDANNAPDGTLRPASSVIGTYAGRMPRGGYFLRNLHRPTVLGLLLLSPLLWLVAAPLLEWAREEDEPEVPSESDGKSEDETP